MRDGLPVHPGRPFCFFFLHSKATMPRGFFRTSEKSVRHAGL
jgi:hypothetical protein